MLQGLGQHLRCCGVDVVILDNSGDHSKAVEVGVNTMGHFRVHLGLHFKARLSAKSVMKISFHSY